MLDRQILSDPDVRATMYDQRYLVDRCRPPLGCFLPFPRVFTTDDDRFASIPLRGSADPRARNKETALRQQAIKERMSSTLA